MAADASAESILTELDALAARLTEVEAYLHIDEARGRVIELEQASSAPGFWDDADAARAHMAELSQVKGDVELVDRAHERLSDARAALELAEEMGEDGAEFVAEAVTAAEELTRAIDEMELSSWFTGEFDHGSAILSIKPGQGGLEAQDWTFMLFKMYMKYCARRGWKVTVNDCPAAEVIGIDRATITVEGKDAFGMLRAEAGVHRLVRISPTDATGIVVTCQNERSQIQNKAACMQILKARLYELELEKRGEMLDEIRGPKTDIGFGNQIRSYVLYPYQMVKDLRSGVETSNVDGVLEDGDLDPFIIGYHRWATEQAE